MPAPEIDQDCPAQTGICTVRVSGSKCSSNLYFGSQE